MKHSYTSSLFTMASQIAQAVSVAKGQDRHDIVHFCKGVGIIFDNISTGKLYPGKFVSIKFHGLRHKGVASHLNVSINFS